MGSVPNDAQVFGTLPRGGTQDPPDVGSDFSGCSGHGPVHLLLTSAAEVGFAWDGDDRGWVRPSLPPLRMMTGPTLLSWMPDIIVSLPTYPREEGFFGS